MLTDNSDIHELVIVYRLITVRRSVAPACLPPVPLALRIPVIGVGNTMVQAPTATLPEVPGGCRPSVLGPNALFCSRHGALGYYQSRSA